MPLYNVFYRRNAILYVSTLEITRVRCNNTASENDEGVQSNIASAPTTTFVDSVTQPGYHTTLKLLPTPSALPHGKSRGFQGQPIVASGSTTIIAGFTR